MIRQIVYKPENISTHFDNPYPYTCNQTSESN